jgi:hypothetical protein
MKIKKFSDFKKRKPTKIKKIEDFTYNFIPTTNPISPAPVPNIAIKTTTV